MGGIYLHAARLADYLSTIEPCCRSRKASNFVAISLSSKNEPELRRKMREQTRRPFRPRVRKNTGVAQVQSGRDDFCGALPLLLAIPLDDRGPEATVAGGWGRRG